MAFRVATFVSLFLLPMPWLMTTAAAIDTPVREDRAARRSGTPATRAPTWSE